MCHFNTLGNIKEKKMQVYDQDWLKKITLSMIHPGVKSCFSAKAPGWLPRAEGPAITSRLGLIAGVMKGS